MKLFFATDGELCRFAVPLVEMNHNVLFVGVSNEKHYERIVIKDVDISASFFQELSHDSIIKKLNIDEEKVKGLIVISALDDDDFGLGLTASQYDTLLYNPVFLAEKLYNVGLREFDIHSKDFEDAMVKANIIKK
jgi:hypothetical protein